MTKTPKDVDKYSENRLKKEELLEDLAYAYGCSTISEQAYQQIKEMIQKPGVTEEWIDKKARELNIQLDFPLKDRFTLLRDFIRSLVKELHVS